MSSTSNSQFADTLINGIVANVICNNGNSRASYKDLLISIVKVLVLYSITDLREFMKYLFGNTKNIISLFLGILSKCKLLRRAHTQIVVHPYLYYDFKVKIENSFNSALYTFLEHKPALCTFQMRLDTMSVPNRKEIVLSHTYTDIMIGNVIISEPVNFNVEMRSGKLIKSENTICQLNPTAKSYLDILTSEQRELVKLIDSKLGNSSRFQLSQYKSKENIWKDYIDIRKFPQKDFDYLPIVYSILVSLDSKCPIFFGHFVTIDPTYSMPLKICFKYHKLGQSSWPNSLIIDIAECHTPCYEKLFDNFWQSMIESTKVNPDILTFKILKTIPDYETQLYNTLTKIMSCKSNNILTKIKLNACTVETRVITKSTPNPEYHEWESKKSMIESKSDNILAVAEFMKLPVPPQMIVDKEITKDIKVTQLNEVSKNIDTLYLREADKKKLMSALVQFRDHKDLLNNLGLTNKLNVLLYGKPGTGKSTTIQSIATYLQKDVCNVDLQSCKTNRDLREITEMINKNIVNGGIVSLEDIDAATNIVLNRTNRITLDCNTVDLANSKDSDLTLEYLLNILQGTLTLDDSVVIVTTNHVDHLDPAFYRDGRFDLKLELKLCDHYQIACIFRDMIGRELQAEVLEKIPEDKYSPATIIYHLKMFLFDKEQDDSTIFAEFME